MIDNRPKKRRAVKPQNIPASVPEPLQATEIHNDAKPTAPDPTPAPAVKAKAVPAGPLAGLGASLGNLGNMGVLPIVLAVSALQRGRGQPNRPVNPAGTLPALPEAIAADPPQQTAGGNGQARRPVKNTVREDRPGTVKAASAQPAQPAEPARTGRKPRSLRGYRKPPDPAPEPLTIEQPAVAAPPQPARVARPGPRPHEIRNLLNDLSGYLPGSGGPSVARISKIMGIADELRNIDSSGVFTASAPANPMDRSIGLLNVLGRNMPNTGAGNLGRASQVLSLVNTLKGPGGGGQGLGGLGGLGNIGNIGNMAGMLSGMMNQNPAPAQEIKNVTPAQADGLKDTVNKLLSGMDDKKKDELLSKAKDFLNKSGK